MAKWLKIVLVLLAAPFALSSPSAAQTSPNTITTDDPAAYSQQLADRVTTDGVAALRPVLTQIYSIQVRVPNGSVQLPPQVEAQFSTMQGLIAGRRAVVVQKLDDVTLANTLRSIYYYYYFGDNLWVFTRFDFARVADGQWALSYLVWSGDQNAIGISPRPDYHATETPSR
ncbi:MAG: hypothetical protein DCF16_09610 [Alphaproteobacteria bacterium]|nr:MAG: hypothetical protein DCF16_09610 [Alphaproteobacteria bacterium]